jgi:hypothetical protein
MGAVETSADAHPRERDEARINELVVKGFAFRCQEIDGPAIREHDIDDAGDRMPFAIGCRSHDRVDMGLKLFR